MQVVSGRSMHGDCDTDDLDCGSNGGLDYSDSDQGTIGLPPLDEDNNDELDDKARRCPSGVLEIFSAIHAFMHSISPWPIYPETFSKIYTCNRHAHQAWQAQLPTLVDHYLAWKHNGPKELAGDHIFHVDVIGVFRCSSADSLEYERHVNVIQKADESANAALLCIGLLGCSPSQPHIAISLQAMMKVLCALQNALGHDGPAWKLCGACPACAFEQPDEPPLSPAWLHSMDGNQSAKHLDGDYFIPHAEVERFKDEVQDRPGEAAREKQFTTCTDNWTTAKAIEENQIQVFEQTSIFVMACCHGFVECIAEMKRSGELMKYGLAAVSRLLNVCGEDQAVGHDVGCASKKTIASSSLGNKVQEKWLKVGFSNKDLETCKRIFSSSNNMAPLIHHASEFHWKQFLDLHFSQWDSDKYLELSKYVELLEKLNFAEATYGSITQVLYLTYTPAEFTSTAGLNESAWQGTNTINAEYASTLQKYQLQLNVMANFECQHNIIDCWTPLHCEYINAHKYMKHCAFIRTVEELEGLVVQQMFELSKANLAKMGYKMHKHISKAISRCLAAICATLERYNKLAPHQHPPCPKLDYAEVISYSLLGEFSLLKHSHYEILEKPWALPDNCEMMMKYYKLQRSQEEITQLNMKVTAQGFWDLGSLELAFEMESMYAERVRVNDFHHAQLQKIYEMPGYMGCRPIGYQPQVMGDGTGNEHEEDDSNDDDSKAFHLGDTLDRVPQY
ncbi:hypothetical protein EDD17DRAFT_1515474 [Pisolithus thermaeus]|nr:hypothetical protein EDD17DRAFT_1515474 [Pisolithus thermaeus]